MVLEVSEKASGISFGALLSGHGDGWIADTKFETVGADVPTTDQSNLLPEEPVNLDFSETE
ncbi:MAG: hypothetical protein ACREN8_01965 [Candidatus Dormibacteraceae bacterium]